MPVPSVPPSTPPQPLGKAHGRAWPVGQIREAGGGGLTEVSRPIRPGSWKAGAAGSRPSGATSVLPAVSRGSSLAKVLSAVSGQRAGSGDFQQRRDPGISPAEVAFLHLNPRLGSLWLRSGFGPPRSHGPLRKPRTCFCILSLQGHLLLKL